VSIKCGRCREYHETVADVRACFNGQNVASTKPEGRTADKLTEPQVKMVNVLLRKLGLVYTAGPVEELEKWGNGRKLIDQLKDAEQRKAHGRDWDLPEGTQVSAKPKDDGPAERTALPEVPHGYYATPSATGHNDLDFWFVNVVTREGKWQGFRAVSRVIGGHAPVRVPGTVRRTALKAIAETGYAQAQMTFAHELGRCYRCGKTLTDDTSRELGIGPKCRAA
jgi:hypothetical protein